MKKLFLSITIFIFLLTLNTGLEVKAAAVEIQDRQLGVPVDVPIDFLRQNKVDSFKVRFTRADEQKIIDLRKTGGSPCLHVDVNNNGQQLLVLVNFQTTNLSALNLKPYQVTDGGTSQEKHKFKLNALPERFYTPGTITLFVFVPKAALRKGKFTLTTNIQDLAAASSSSSTSGGTSTVSPSCQLFQTSGGATCVPVGGGGNEFVTYVLVEGPNVGTLITAQGSTVSQTFNIITQAEGYIAEAVPVTPAMGCVGNHFHGMIFGKDDPRVGMCGQGIVQKLQQSSVNYFNPLSSAIIFEKSAIEEMKKPDYTEAIKDIDDSVKKLDEFNTEFNKQFLATEAMVTREEFMILQEQFPCTKDKDAKAKELLNKLKAGTAELFDETKASKFIIDAMKCKRKLVETLVKLEKRKG